MKRRLKINGILIFCAFVLVAAFPLIFLRNKGAYFFIPDQIAEIFGIAFILLGQIVRVSARGYKSEHSRNGHYLIQGGPYALVRNPMYLGIFLIGFGIVLVLFRWWVGLIFLLVFIARYMVLIFKEEKKLTVSFPKNYPVYQQSVPQLFPSAATLLQKDIAEYLPLKPLWLKREIGSVLAVLLATLFLESWEDIKTKGMLLYFREAAAYLVVIALFVCLFFYLSRYEVNILKNAPGTGKGSL